MEPERRIAIGCTPEDTKARRLHIVGHDIERHASVAGCFVSVVCRGKDRAVTESIHRDLWRHVHALGGQASRRAALGRDGPASWEHVPRIVETRPVSGTVWSSSVRRRSDAHVAGYATVPAPGSPARMSGRSPATRSSSASRSRTSSTLVRQPHSPASAPRAVPRW